MRHVNYSIQRLFVEITTALMVLLFVYAGLSKLLNHPLFVTQLEASPILKRSAIFLAWLVPLSELIIAVLLLFRRSVSIARFAFTFLMALFTIYISILLSSGLTLPCSCGGVIAAFSWQKHLLFNIVFVLLGIASILVNKENNKRQWNYVFICLWYAMPCWGKSDYW